MDTRIPKNDIDFLMKNLNPRIIELPKETIITKDDMKYHLCVMLDGLVYLCAKNSDSERAILGFYRAREYFSKNMLLPIEAGEGYFYVKNKAYVVYFDYHEIVCLNAENRRWVNSIVNNVFAMSECSLIKTNLIYHHKTLRQKLVYFFKNEAEKQRNNSINIPLPFTDLADFFAVDRTALMKEIRNMKNENLISGKNRKITVNFL